jgi:CheY-like chemotaxis protein
MSVRTVVLVEDDADLARIVMTALEMEGAKVFSALDGRAGLDLVRKHKPNAVVLDMMMPKMNGYEVCAAIQADPELRNIPLIVITALTKGVDSCSDAEWRERLGVAAFFSKPFEIKELTDSVLAAMG